MSVLKRGDAFYLRIRPFDNRLLNVRTPAQSKNEAKQIEMSVLVACRSGDYRNLSPESRETCVRMFRNQGWSLPPELGGAEVPEQELTLWRGLELFFGAPEIRECGERGRYEQCAVHLVSHFGKDRTLASLWVPEIRAYMMERSNQGVSPSQVNREKGTLSKMFQVLVEHRILEVNPCRLVKNLSQKSEQRHVYLAFNDVMGIVDRSPAWMSPIIMVGYYSGLRQGEILGLSARQINLTRRMITFSPGDTKEKAWKKVPIHHALDHIFRQALKVRQLGADSVFLCDGTRPNRHSVTNSWTRAVRGMDLDPLPRFHDLRHTWRANARRSGVDSTIAEAIMGHWFRGKKVHERYGAVSEDELLAAIDSMTFDHGESEVWTARR